MFDKRGATFDPITIIAVGDAIDIAHFSRVNMAANHTVGAPAARFFDHSVFEF